jgi:hypothetical protein
MSLRPTVAACLSSLEGAPDVGGECPRVPISLRRLLREGSCNGIVDRGWKLRTLRRHGKRPLRQVRIHERGIAVPAEGWNTCEDLVREATQRVDVGPGVEGPSLELLGCRVIERSHELTGLRDPALGGCAFRQPEIREVDELAGRRSRPDGDQHVAGFDVAMHEPTTVCGVERVRHLAHDRGGALRFERPLGAEERAKVGALDISHRDVQDPVDLTGLVDRHDVRMLEGGGQPRLANEPLAEALVFGEIRGQDLERDPPFQAQVFGEIHDAHPTAAEHRLDPISGELGTWTEVHQQTLREATPRRKLGGRTTAGRRDVRPGSR